MLKRRREERRRAREEEQRRGEAEELHLAGEEVSFSSLIHVKKEQVEVRGRLH